MVFIAPKAGEEVGLAIVTRHGKHDIRFAKVVRVNTYGHLTLDDGSVFDKYGKPRSKDIGFTLHNAAELRTYSEAQRLREAKQTTARRAKLLWESCWTKDGEFEPSAEARAELLAMLSGT